ncbi:methyltransferase domain-containing protein [Scytonema sp. UIC 10036]|uniref:class I SAM-dependent DNA methyltransferase n=1 Tax=Scytonema sp. UIC 10036 TaxID=2304196 RepID=UPI0012DAE677|nr:class I SAM-dependent methyltransferase [Scytonema sp. UIC 10036]MUG99025.1 methyltransferase domain-containing protein [Scytonema sp. UIC 10036]
MNVFGNYARYYDLLYRDKDYVGEAQFIRQLLQIHASDAISILELGCGTGLHAVLLAKEGYQVHGVDISTQMLEISQSRLAQLPLDIASRLKFSQGDIRLFRTKQQFDAIVSLFHVVSYQTTNKALQATFATVKSHLKPGGVFIFDAWYGPAVLSDRPTTRIKRLEDEEVTITRIAEPVMYANENLVDVNYQIFIKDKNSGVLEELQETHCMRYLFKPEIELLLQQFQMELLEYREWMSDREPGFDTWGVYFVVRI